MARVGMPVLSPDDVVAAISGAVTTRTRLAVVDHVTSPTAVVFPICRIVAELNARGVPVLVDGAHAPGMLALDVTGIGADYYTGNCHKWMCAPKAAGFLWVREPDA
ncbi:MAG: aminotransferase class V-fold PLP-dependent enzyme, partial [Actinobacteria bacterium]|nr:aminotransferase class V-fold PLP-dependent enzyme [Actinomycetota bacterium]NIS34877.1 aminotransferase class V-fold PLP-dependent enzyme [Actinomycetota bacterium]